MGVGLHYQTVQSVVNLTDFNMTIEEAANAPRLLLPISPEGDQKNIIVRVVTGEFPDDVLQQTGLEIRQVAPEDARFAQGLWVAIARDQSTKTLMAISPSYTNGQATAF